MRPVFQPRHIRTRNSGAATFLQPTTSPTANISFRTTHTHTWGVKDAFITRIIRNADRAINLTHSYFVTIIRESIF